MGSTDSNSDPGVGANLVEDILTQTDLKNRGEAFIAQSGVKGMRWGHRKTDASDGGAPKVLKDRGKIRRGLTKANTAKKAGRAGIDKGEESLIFLPQKYRNQAATATQQRVLGVAMRVNKDPQFKGKDLKRDPELKEAYYKKIRKEVGPIYREELAVARSNAAFDVIDAYMDARRETVSVRTPAPPAYQPKHKLEHAVEMVTLVTFKFKKNELGQVVGIDIDPASLEHSGVKGMKWGVRKSDSASTPTLLREKKAFRNSSDVTVTQKKSGTYVTTKGGKRQKASDDAVKAHAGRQKAKSSTTDSLTNNELKAVVERMRLEQEFAKLDGKVKRKGSSFVGKLLNTDAGKQVAKKASEMLANKVAKPDTTP